MFKHVTLRGRGGSIAWGYATVARVERWKVSKVKPGIWSLASRVTHVDRFALARAVKDRDRPALFTAPRERGMWCWPIRSAEVRDSKLFATLGPPEY